MTNGAIRYVRRRLNLIIDQLTPDSFVALPGNRAESDNGRYIAFINKVIAKEKYYRSFKRHRHYREILEHVTKKQGEQYITELMKQSADLVERIDLFKTNDLIGDPVRYKYTNPVGTISPTTLRYLKVASDISLLFEGLDGCAIVEIGVGYGGQLLILDKVAHIKAYTLIDLPPVLALASKYLESHILRGSYSCKTLNQYDIASRVDLAISNYAFSEFPSHLQRAYISKVLLGATRGYLTMNSGLPRRGRSANKLLLAELRDLLPPFEVINERPLTGRDNYIIVWGHKPTATKEAHRSKTIERGPQYS